MARAELILTLLCMPVKTDKAFLAAPSDSYSASTSHNTSDDDELPLFLHLLENALFPLPSLERILISARDEAQQTRIAQSITARQHSPTTHPIETLLDKEEWRNKGPATGILTAHEQYPDSTLLVLAVDFPKTSAEALQELIRGHEQAKVEAPVTCFLHPEDGNPEVCL